VDGLNMLLPRGQTHARSAIHYLLQMKLSNNRPIDQVHVQDLASVGLATPEIERHLPPASRDRLREIGELEA